MTEHDSETQAYLLGRGSTSTQYNPINVDLNSTRPTASQVSDDEAQAFKMAEKRMREENNRLVGRALLVNGWLHRLRVHRGSSFTVGPSDMQALEQIEHWADSVPHEDPAT